MTISSLVSVIMFNMIFIIFIYMIVKNNSIVSKTGFSFLLFVCIFSIVRYLFPFEFPFMITLRLKYLWPPIFLFFANTKIALLNFQFSLTSFLLTVWLLGILLLTCREIYKYMKLKLYIKSFNSVENKTLLLIKETILCQYNKYVDFQLIETPFTIPPTICGIINPYILIPKVPLSDKYWQFVLQHEIAHYYNKDIIIKLLCQIICIIYWWNPFIYLLKNRIHDLLELNVDSKVTKFFNNQQKIDYLNCLLNIAKLCNTPIDNSIMSSSFVHQQSIFKQRFNMVLKNTDVNKKNAFPASFTIFSVFIIVMGCSFSFILEPYSVQSDIEKSSYELTTNNSFYIRNAEGTYDLYLDNIYFGTVNEIFDQSIIIYANMEEALNEAN